MGQHIFFDSTEAISKKILWDYLLKVAETAKAKLYVTDLTVAEMSSGNLIKVRDTLKSVRELAAGIEKYVEIRVPELNEDRLFEEEQSKVTEMMRKADVMIIPTSPVTLQEILRLSTRRLFPFEIQGRNKDVLFGYHDAVILIACLKYAAENRLGDCWFVSSDSRFYSEGLKRAALQYKCPQFRLMKSSEEAAAFLHALHGAGIASLNSDLVVKATEFLDKQRDAIYQSLSALDNHFKSDAHFYYDIPNPVEITDKIVSRVEVAVPHTSTPNKGKPCDMTFAADLEIDAVSSDPDHPEFPRKRTFTERVIGRATAEFRKGGFYGDVCIKTLEIAKNIRPDPPGQMRLVSINRGDDKPFLKKHRFIHRSKMRLFLSTSLILNPSILKSFHLPAPPGIHFFRSRSIRE